MHKYGIIIYWSDEDQIFIAEVPELPGCITHGDSQNAALANANEAIQLWIDTAKEFNNAVPEPNRQRLTLGSVEFIHDRSEERQRAITSLPSRRKNRPSVYYDPGTSRARITNPQAR